MDAAIIEFAKLLVTIFGAGIAVYISLKVVTTKLEVQVENLQNLVTSMREDYGNRINRLENEHFK